MRGARAEGWASSPRSRASASADSKPRSATRPSTARANLTRGFCVGCETDALCECPTEGTCHARARAKKETPSLTRRIRARPRRCAWPEPRRAPRPRRPLRRRGARPAQCLLCVSAKIPLVVSRKSSKSSKSSPSILDALKLRTARECLVVSLSLSLSVSLSLKASHKRRSAWSSVEAVSDARARRRRLVRGARGRSWPRLSPTLGRRARCGDAA